MDNEISEINTCEVEKNEDECKPIEFTKEGKNMKEEKVRKKDDKSVKQVLKALSSLDTPEEKLAAMCEKYSDIVDDNRKLQLALKKTEKKVIVMQREKEQFQSEHSKAILTRSRLESLCRELQRQNKAIKEESLLRIREEEEKRKEVSAKFQNTLSELTSLTSQNNEKCTKLHEDNMELANNFKSLCEQYELREIQVEKMTQQMKLQSQLAEAKLAEAKMELTIERESLLKEKQQLLVNLIDYQVRIREHQKTEASLKDQISMYKDKYEEFQNALTKSNEVFGGFKTEMEEMSQKILKLEKESSSWKQRWENSHAALLEMAADKQQRDAELATTSRKLAQLQQLCRALQGERASLLGQLRGKALNSEVETMEQVEKTEPMVDEESIESIKRVDDLSKDCRQLKEDLVQLQGSLKEAMKQEENEIQQNKGEIESQKLEQDKRETKEQQGEVLVENIEQIKEEVSHVKDEEPLKNDDEVSNKRVEDEPDQHLDESKTENGEIATSTKPSEETSNKVEKKNDLIPVEPISETEKNASTTEIVEPVDQNVEDLGSALDDEHKSNEPVSPVMKKGKDGKKKKK